MLHSLAPFAHLLLLSLKKGTSAEQQNIIVDVALSYLPVGGWAVGNICKDCSAQPDPSQTLDETWHDASSMHNDNLQHSIGFNFTGIAVYAYFIVANRFSYPTLMNLTFSMDGKQTGTFNHTPSSVANYEYSMLVYSITNLDNVSHSLNISTTGNEPSLMLFDYFNYTVDNDLAGPIEGSSRPALTSFATGSSVPSNNIRPTSQNPLPSSTSTPTEVPTKNARSDLIVGVLIGAIVAVIAMILLTLTLLVRRGGCSSLLPCLYRRNDPRTYAIQPLGSDT